MSMDKLPDEIINHLLSYVPPGDILSNFQLVSRRLNNIADEPLLWRHHCLGSFRFWQPTHNLQGKLRQATSLVDWKRLFVQRMNRNARISDLLNEIITTKTHRLRNYEEICLLGYDAKDFLLAQCHTDDSAEDVLARRYVAFSLGLKCHD